MKVAFIGLGLMGAPMAANILNGGHELVVHNRTRSKEEPYVERGAKRAASPAEAASKADVTIVCVSDAPDVMQVICGKNGVLEGARPGSVVIDMSTVGVKAARDVATTCREKLVNFLDAPVSGGVPGAEKGTLSIMVGGDAQTLKNARPVLETMGKTITHCGETGKGQATKLVNQVVGICNAMAAAEGLTFALRAGLDPKKTIQAVGGGAASSWSWKTLGPKMVAEDYEGMFKVSLQSKDLRLVLEEAEELNLPMPLTRMAQNFLKYLEGKGQGENGTQSIFEVFQELAEH